MMGAMTYRPRPPDPIPADVVEVLDALGVDVRTRVGFASEIRRIPGAPWTLIEPWPYQPGIPGPLRFEDGTPVHGAAVRPRRSGLDVLVAIAGWPLEQVACPRPPNADLGPVSP